jgi:cyclohexanone monooxygenase
MPYVAGVGPYRAICDEVAANGYEGFAFGGPGDRL